MFIPTNFQNNSANITASVTATIGAFNAKTASKKLKLCSVRVLTQKGSMLILKGFQNYATVMIAVSTVVLAGSNIKQYLKVNGSSCWHCPNTCYKLSQCQPAFYVIAILWIFQIRHAFKIKK